MALGLPDARAGLILNFAQTSGSNTITATNTGNTGADGGTQLSAVGVQVLITQLDAPLTTPITAYLNLSALSVTDVTGSGDHIQQDYDGTSRADSSHTFPPGPPGLSARSGSKPAVWGQRLAFS